MDVALFHHQPPAGGAMRVLTEYARRTPNDLTLYTRKPPAPPLATVGGPLRTRHFLTPQPRSRLGRVREIAALPRRGRALAAAIDAAGHDVAFVHMSDLVQAPEVLPFLRTPALYYAPEPLRAVYEPEPSFGRSGGARAALARRGLNAYELRRARLDDRAIRTADLVVTHSRFTAGELRRLQGVHAEVVQLGVDANAFTPAPVAREGYVLAVGALHPLKGHQFVIEAVATMPEPRPPVVLVADRGHLADVLGAHARRCGVVLDLRRAVSFAELLDLYRRAGVLACGQIREPFGLTPLEAMATATPVVAAAEGGFLETIRDGETGLLAPRCAHAFGSALQRVLDDPGLAADLGRRGRAAVEREWTWERTAAGFDGLLARLAATAAARSAPARPG